MGLPKLFFPLLSGLCLATTHASAVRFVTVDSQTGVALSCRVHLKDEAGKPVRANGLPFWRDHFACAGVATIDLLPGQYSYQIDRGPEYAVESGALTIAGSSGVMVTNRLRRLVDLSQEGWWSGELHVHRALADIPLLMQAADLHIAPVITWWNDRNLWEGRSLPENPLVHFDGDRFYHLLGGEDERAGGALMYFNLARPLSIAGAKWEYPSPVKFMAEARRHPGAWIDIEKPFWYDVPVWLATGWVDSIGIAHNHMQWSGVLSNEAWGRPRDKQRFPDPQGNGLWTQEIYYQILNSGFRLPPSAGSASGVLPNPVGYNRVYVHLDGPLTYASWWEGLRAGHVFVSNGPLLRCRANGQLPGHIFHGKAGEPLDLQIDAKLNGRDAVKVLEVIQNGEVVREVPVSNWERSGSLGAIRFEQSGWFLIRTMAEVPGTFRFASTGPFYVEIGAAPRRISKRSAEFFLRWVRERQNQIRLEDGRQKDEVLQYHRAAERFWEKKIADANAD